MKNILILLIASCCVGCSTLKNTCLLILYPPAPIDTNYYNSLGFDGLFCIEDVVKKKEYCDSANGDFVFQRKNNTIEIQNKYNDTIINTLPIENAYIKKITRLKDIEKIKK